MSVEVTPASRAQAFREQMSEMKVPAPSVGRDRLFARVGLLLAMAGIVLGVVGLLVSHNTNSALTQNDALTVAILGVACSVTGAAVYLRYSLSQFLRLWLIRLIHEQRG